MVDFKLTKLRRSVQNQKESLHNRIAHNSMLRFTVARVVFVEHARCLPGYLDASYRYVFENIFFSIRVVVV